MVGATGHCGDIGLSYGSGNRLGTRSPCQASPIPQVVPFSHTEPPATAGGMLSRAPFHCSQGAGRKTRCAGGDGGTAGHVVGGQSRS